MVSSAPAEIVDWLPSGDAFRISDLQRLESETLPAHFRHSRFQSLVRQLNFYNFRKVNRERTFWVYKHPLFHRDRPQDLPLLRRKTCGTTPVPDKAASDAKQPVEPPKNSRSTSSGSSGGRPPRASPVDQLSSAAVQAANQYAVPGYGHLHSTRSPSPTFSASDLDSSDDDNDKQKSKNKRSRSERSHQSLTVSNVAQQLEVYAKRHRTQSADVTPLFEEDEQQPRKKKRAASMPLPASRNSDTMKYHALTYDDEVDEDIDEEVVGALKFEEGGDESEECVSSLSSPSARSPSPGVLTPPPSSSSSVSYKTPSASSIKSSVFHSKLTITLPASDTPISKSHLIHTSSPYYNELSSPPIKDESLYQKITTKISALEPSTNAALTRFCLSTPPTSVLSCESAGFGALTSLLDSNENLKLDFEQYRLALSPRSSFSHDTGCDSSSLPSLPETLKDFTPFCANHLADTFKSGYESKGDFNHQEIEAVKQAIQVWFRAAVVTQ